MQKLHTAVSSKGGQVDKNTSVDPRAKPKTLLDSSDPARQFEGQKSPDPLHQVDQACKNVPQVPVSIPYKHPRVKPKAPLNSSDNARQF